MDGFNFAPRRVPLSAVLEQLSRYALFEDPPSVAVQSALIRCLPDSPPENRLPLLDAAVAPRIWLGNRVTVPALFDESFNLACVIAGRRRFTLFPPAGRQPLYRTAGLRADGCGDEPPTWPSRSARFQAHGALAAAATAC